MRSVTARDVGIISSLHKKTSLREDQEKPTVQVSVLYPQFSYSQTVPVKVYQDFLFFFFVSFQVRSCPVPHRGERVEQGTVHPRNIAILT